MISLTFLIMILFIIFAIDTVQKRRSFLDHDK